MTAGSTLLWVLVLLAGAAVLGCVDVELRLWERAALGVVVGVCGSAAACLLVALVVGFSWLSVLGGPLLLGGAAAAVAGRCRVGPLAPWRASLAGARAAPTAEVASVAAIAAASLAVALWLLLRGLYDSGGAIVSDYPTVWADWSLHATLASSFAVAGNVPPQDPIFSGEALRYPFLPDLGAAMLRVTGDSVGISLAVPGAVLVSAIAVLLASLTRRLCGSYAVGALALVIAVGGGSLGFTGAWWDACHAAGHADAECAVDQALLHPGTAVAVLRAVPAELSAPPRPYDNLQAASGTQVGNVQWYTPLLAWWLPQRTFLWGTAIGLSVLLLVVASRRGPPLRAAWVVAGLLAGLLPLVHVHTLLTLLVVLPLLGLGTRRREWWWLAGAAAAVAVPRLLQIAAGGHGVAATCVDGSRGGGGTGTEFPYLEPGWLSAAPTALDAGACAVPGRYAVSVTGVLRAVPAVLRTAVDPSFWGFWLVNTGLVLVVAAAGVAVAAARMPAVRGRLDRLPLARLVEAGLGMLLAALLLLAGSLGIDGLVPLRPLALAVVAAAAVAGTARLVAAAVPPALLGLTLPLLAVFAVANVVVFQTWDWDNTKLLAWAYLGGALLTAAVIVWLLRRGPLGAAAAGVALATVLASAGLALTRYARVDPGPYTWARPDDISVAAYVRDHTDRGAVFLTAGSPTDPILTLAGRTAVSGYGGWLYSYGIDVGNRPADIATMLAGCTTAPGCAVPELLRQYHVDYVEMCSDPASASCQGSAWYASRFPVLVGVGSRTVYDVRRA